MQLVQLLDQEAATRLGNDRAMETRNDANIQFLDQWSQAMTWVVLHPTQQLACPEQNGLARIDLWLVTTDRLPERDLRE